MERLEQYVQLDWSPTTWALLQLAMVLVTVLVMGVTVTLAARASQATKPAEHVHDVPELDTTSSSAPARAA